MTKKTKNLITTMLALVVVFFIQNEKALSQNVSTKQGSVTIEGTSNIHDWEMVSDKGNCSVTIIKDANGNITAMNNIVFSVSINTIKSDKGSTMDNNAYKAMDAEKFPLIYFKSTSTSIKPAASGGWVVTAQGKLNISSGVRDVTLVGVAKSNPDNSITVNGNYKLLTTDYNVKPISIMLGAIKTSASVNIVYSLSLK
ncbi:MAG: YceI family protein [Chitinophagaceae bacterium]